jgi:hypothetical protein
MPETTPEIKAVRKTLRFMGEEPFVYSNGSSDSNICSNPYLTPCH